MLFYFPTFYFYTFSTIFIEWVSQILRHSCQFSIILPISRYILVLLWDISVHIVVIFNITDWKYQTSVFTKHYVFEKVIYFKEKDLVKQLHFRSLFVLQKFSSREPSKVGDRPGSRVPFYRKRNAVVPQLRRWAFASEFPSLFPVWHPGVN